MASSNQKTRRRAHSKVRDKKVADDANTLAYSMTENATPSNMDLRVDVFGYTHRNGFKLRVSNIEQLTNVLMDEWRSKCAALGYSCNVSYNASLSTALLHASKTTDAGTKPVLPAPANPFARVHPLTFVAAVLFAVNAGRHFLQNS